MILQVFYCVKPNTIRNIVALLFDQSKIFLWKIKRKLPIKNSYQKWNVSPNERISEISDDVFWF